MTSARTRPVDLGARRRGGEDAITRVAAAPVRHVTPAFLAALNCRRLPPLRETAVH